MADDYSPLQSALILARIEAQTQATSDVVTMMKVRRLLVAGERSPQNANYTGTYIPAPFNGTSLALKTATAFPMQATQYYESRIAANVPEVAVQILSQRSSVTQTLERQAGEQERLDNELLDAAGIRQVQRQAGWAMATGGVAFVRVLPRDADWGLPSRTYYDGITDEEVKRLKREGKITPVKVPGPSGALVFAEHGDVWAARRKDHMKARAVSGLDLFSLRAYPRDMMRYELDNESQRLGPKWAASIEEIPGASVAEGSALAISAARMRGVPADDQGLYGIYRDGKGNIVGGVARGIPESSEWSRPEAFTLVRYSDRLCDYIYVAPKGGYISGAMLVYTGEHGCTVMGAPANPFVEVPFFRTDTDYHRQAYATPMDQVFALTPLINQVLTLRSNATAYNLLPRWVVELKDGSVLRGEDGQPQIVNGADTPGLDPSEATAWPGTLRQLTIETADSDELLKVLLELVAQAMPSQHATGAETASTAWGEQETQEAANEIFEEPCENFANATRGIVWRMHGWLRQLDMPVQFFPAPKQRKNKQSLRALIEFDPKDLTDSIKVTQSTETDAQRTVKVQIGMTLLQGGLITREEFYDRYMDSPDARQEVIDGYVEMIVDYVMYGRVPVDANPNIFPQSVVVQIADGVRGRVHYELIQQSDNYALKTAQDMAAQANAMQQPMQPQLAAGSPVAMQPQQGLGGGITAQTGARAPGVGMAPTLAQQTGGPPGGNTMTMPQQAGL